MNCKLIDLWYTPENYFGNTRAGDWNGFGYSLYYDERADYGSMCVSIIVDMPDLSKYINAYNAYTDDWKNSYHPQSKIIEAIWKQP